MKLFKKIISLAKVPPANGPPALRYAYFPMRMSDFKAAVTSSGFAPTLSQIDAISLAKTTEFAKKNLLNAWTSLLIY